MAVDAGRWARRLIPFISSPYVSDIYGASQVVLITVQLGKIPRELILTRR